MVMAQISSPNPEPLPGIVTDQPEIYESEPALSDDTGVENLDSANDLNDDAVALIEVPIKQAFSYFAERENEIAQFYVQRFGEYKLNAEKPDDETDVERYHRLVSEVNGLLEKFHADKSSNLNKSELTGLGTLSNAALSNNLDVLSRQLKTLEFAAESGDLNPAQAELNGIQSKLNKFGEKGMLDDSKQVSIEQMKLDDATQLMRLSALERRLNSLETCLGFNEKKTQSIFKATKCENLSEAMETISSWLSFMKPDNVQRVSRELDFLSQRMEALNSEHGSNEKTLEPQQKAKLDKLCSLITTTDKYRAMVPTIIHRLNVMEELQQKAAQVATTVNHLEQVQAQIVDSLQSNKVELSSLNEMFAQNIKMIKEVSKDIDSRIASIHHTDDE